MEKPTRVDFMAVEAGDTVLRLLAGRVPMQLNVTLVDEDLIHCGPWTFSRRTGREVDPELSLSASYLANYTKP
jgi:hypothetical protein